jgi:hypothetical protein
MAELEAAQAAQYHRQNEHETQTQTPTQHLTHDLERSSVSSSKEKEGRRWAQIYSYSYSQNLTGCVKQLEVLQKYTKEIVGEQGWVDFSSWVRKERLIRCSRFDPIDTTDYEDLTQERGKAYGILDGHDSERRRS